MTPSERSMKEAREIVREIIQRSPMIKPEQASELIAVALDRREAETREEDARIAEAHPSAYGTHKIPIRDEIAEAIRERALLASEARLHKEPK